MGLLTEGRYRHQFGTGTNQIDLAQQAKNVYTPKFQFESSLVSAMPSIFMGLTEKFANIDFSGGGGSGSSKPAEVNPNHDGKLSAGGEEIKAEIRGIYSKYSCSSIDELKLMQERIEARDAQLQTLETTIQSLEGNITKLTNNITTLKSQLCELQFKNPSNVDLRKLEFDIHEKENELKQLQAQKTELDGHKSNLTTEIDSKLTVDTIKSDIARVEQLSASLRRLEGRDGRDAIQNMTNENTSEFTRMFSQYMEIKNDPKKQNQAQRLLNNLHEFYNQNFANKSDIPTHVANAYKILPPKK